ncbi:MAG TPA: NAD-dependent epimerase/dehydratase family protein [Planctomycetes bacterium]|nr:NAD-dependent epimerase/dehydratase family protein [Planctomycetota bacterium]
MKPRTLITGAAGFIGSNLAHFLLERGEEVYGLDDLSTGSRGNVEDLEKNSGFHFETGSILDEEPLKRLVGTVNSVYHLAAAVGVKYILQRPFESLETNVEGTRNVLRCALLYRKRVLVTSSSEVYGKNPRMPLSEEDDRVLGATQSSRWSYSGAKALDEFMALAAHRTRGLDVRIARLFNVVGPGQTGRYGMVLPTFVSQALEGRPITVYGDGSQTRTFCHVQDAVEALYAMMQSEKAAGEIINVGGGEEITIRGLAERVKKMLASDSPVSVVSYREAYGEGFDDMPRRVPSLEKAARLLDWRPQRTLDDAIRDTADFISSRKEIT